MAENNAGAMGIGTILVIMIVTGLVVGVVLGVIGAMLNLNAGTRTAGVGAAVGVIGAYLFSRRRAALGQSRNP